MPLQRALPDDAFSAAWNEGRDEELDAAGSVRRRRFAARLAAGGVV
jgi:hypothetical protein